MSLRSAWAPGDPVSEKQRKPKHNEVMGVRRNAGDGGPSVFKPRYCFSRSFQEFGRNGTSLHMSLQIRLYPQIPSDLQLPSSISSKNEVTTEF